ncbi:MAG: NPCBM/NEW2 domain-containing protein [Clostridium sp.]|uniref:NPCBM/NEW2 domain-containing protein n=1 Tax=Clostridium sp. TaxID=1506 RepID=UPI00290F1E65|nr:NPCBM/NEW2 domain-containing protein [Clostridium sp.]MDU5110717.1 NPCBM/NEW2 domain-containing protein [Clostridium sp.]
MNKRKIAALILAAVITNFSSPSLKVLADEIVETKIVSQENKAEATTAKVSRLEAYHNGKDAEYSELYRMPNSNITEISANGGVYPGTQLEYMLDDNPATHWETNTNNNEEFTNEVIFTLDKPQILDRVAFLARDNRKGFPEEFEIYASERAEGDTFELVSKGTAKSTNDFLQFKFEPTNFKRIKFKFVKANINRPFVAEFRFYKEDITAGKIERLFTDNTKSVVSEEFNSIEKINALEEEAKKHPFYVEYKTSLEDAKILLKKKEIEATTAKVSRLEAYHTGKDSEYSKVYRMSNSNITNVSANGGVYPTTKLEYMLDDKPETHWETNTNNSNDFTNEVIFTLDKPEVLNRIAFLARDNRKGFPEQFEIYASETTNGDTFQLVSTGTAQSTNDFLEFKFEPTKFKRIKFKFVKANINRPFVAEFRFYKEDAVADKIERLFTDSTMSTVSEEFNTVEKINSLEEEAKSHPLYDSFKESLENARELSNQQKIEATTAKTRQFEDYSNEEYSNLFKMDNININSIKNNAGNYSTAVITNAIDGDLNTYWETNKGNTSDFTNEVEVEFKEAVELNRIVYGARPSDRKGFAKEFEVYASTTSKGDTYQLVATGTHDKVSGLVEAKFNPTKFKRVKFKFKNSDQNWATLSEIAFYKEDPISDKIDNLFTDNTMSTVSEEFNSIEKINELEEEAKKHPLYESFKEDLANAKELVNNQKIETTTATTIQFEHYSNEEYSNLFKMDNENIKSIKNNAGQYLSQVITNAIDGNLDTYWETNKSNTSEFSNEVEVEFKEAVELNRIVYGARKSDSKGFATEFEIYGSMTSKGDTYQLVATGQHSKTSGLVEAKFNPTKFKRVKFKFKKGDQDWATLSELAFYKQDKLSDKIDTLFTNGLMNELSKDFNTIEKLEALENETKGHPLESSFKELFEMAHKIIKGELETVKVITAEQHGNMEAHARNNLKFGFGNNNQPTGISAKPGDVITVYVDADPTKPLPRLAFSQQEGSYANWLRTVNLQPGKNVITVPNIPTDNWYKHDVTRGGSIYIVNPYTSEEQPKAPVIRFASGDKFPFVTKDTNIDDFKNFLIEYKKAIDEDIEKNSNVLNRKVLDVFEFVSDHIVWTGTATGAYQAYIEQGVNPLDTIKSYNTHMEEIFKYYGLDGSNEKNDPKFIRENVRLAQPFGYMYAATGHIGVQRDVMANHLVPFEERGPSWGLTHEIGHKMDVYERLYGEVTNNMLPMYMSVYYNKIDNRIPFESEVYNNVISENSNKYIENGVFGKLAVYWQLEMYKPGYWGKLNKLYRERSISLGSENAENVKMQYLVKFSSEVIGEDLSEYFARHGFEVNDETRVETSKYKKSDKKIWYLNNSKANYKGNGFTQDTNLEVALNRVENGVKLSFSIDNGVKSDLLGYEIFRDGELIGFTSTNSFIDTNVDTSKNYKYEVIPYDINLGTDEAVEANTFGASINLQQKNITLKLREEFDPLNYIKALNYEGNDITSKVFVEQNVDTSKIGNYYVKYIVTDNDIEVERVVKVEVVSDYDYLSDENWASVETQWGTPRRNTNIKGRVNGEEKEFEKGFGIHANGKIIYDLSGKDYDNFEALLGVDTSIAEQNNSSIKFEIIADGKVLATTNVLKHADDMVYINVPVKDVQELVIKVTDAGNGNTSDHSVIANPKLTTNNAKPVLTVQDKVYKIGEDVDFKEGISAKDAEDGDLTSNIEIISNSYVEGKTGRFEVVYKVTDSDNNSVEKKSYVTVYEDFTVNKSMFGKFDNLDKYNEEFKIPVFSVSNNAGRYGNSVIENSIDGNVNTHWETNKPNSDNFQNEVIFDLGESKEINRIAYKPRNGGKGFAKKFEIYISNEVEGNDFILAGKGEYTGSVNDLVEFKIAKTTARRVMFKFIEAHENWAAIGELTFYKEDALADKMNSLFTDNTKTEVTESYNTLEKVETLREEVKNHPAANLFEEDLVKAEKIIKAKFPTLNVEEITYVKLNSDFDLTSGVTANDQEDGNITENIQVNSNDFNTGKSGEYTITYTVTDSDNNVTTKDRKVVVYSESAYLSDIEWESAVSGWKSVNKDSAVNLKNKIKLKVNGEIKEFDKGIGAATNAEIVYNLDGNYTNFSTYVGTDKNYDDNRTTIIFKIFADGQEVYTSDVIRKGSEAELVNLDVTGVKELKLVANDADGNGLGDFASWGDTKVYTTNAKPKLTIPASVATKLGQEVDLNKEVSAIDAEDGDITEKVEVTGKVNFNKPGKYEISYKVVDSDRNEIVKTRTISVVDMNDYKYLTDYDWKSANSGWKTVNKDKSVENNKLGLTQEDGEAIYYDRGIGTHATSTIIYDLTDKNYEYFTSFVGVDREVYGNVSSISFEVYVDGEKKFDSGIMNSKDIQKNVEVNITEANELKLVVRDGGNGNAADHATWGDAKLHFANDVQANYNELESLLNEAKKYVKDNYTEESFKVLENALNKANVILEDKISTQEEVNSIIEEVNKAIDNLEEAVDLNEVINISDKYLKAAIKQELKLSSDNITIGDMHKLINVSFSGKGIENIEALKYARNLETIDLSYNEIKDLSPLKNLKKLTSVNAHLQIITEGMLYAKDNKITLDYKVLNKNGDRLIPKAVSIKSNRSNEAVNLSLEEIMDENGVVSFDISKFDKYLHSMYIVYEDAESNFLSQSLFMFDVK